MQKVHFCHFLVIFGVFWSFSGHLWFLSVFHVFGGVRFPNGKTRKVVIFMKFHRKTRKNTKMFKMSPTNLTPEKVSKMVEIS